MIKLLPYILFEKYIYNLASLAASPGNRHCANCIGTLSFPISCRVSGTKACASDSALLTIVRVYKIYLLTYLLGWWRGTVVERRSLAGELSLPALDLQLMGDH